MLADAFRLWALLLIISAGASIVMPVLAGVGVVAWWSTAIPVLMVVGLILAGLVAFCALFGLGHRI